jgi:hypothetical protein
MEYIVVANDAETTSGPTPTAPVPSPSQTQQDLELRRTAPQRALTQNAVPSATADAVAHLPPISAPVRCFLGLNPIGTLLPADIQMQVP